MASPPHSRFDFEIAIVCALPLEADAVLTLFDTFWDDNGDQYGRARGDQNTYTTGRMGNFDIVLVLLPSMGKVSAASAAASLRSSYPELKLVLLTGICGGVPKPAPGVDVILGDVIISKTVVQYDLGRQYPDTFSIKDGAEGLGKAMKQIQSFIIQFETNFKLEKLEKRAAAFLELLQQKANPKYQYPGTTEDRLFEASHQHKHHRSPACLCANFSKCGDPVCEESRGLSCDELGCNDLVQRERLREKQELQITDSNQEAQAFSIFIGRFGSGDKVLKSGEDRDRIARDHKLMAFEMEGAGLWGELPCLVVKAVCDYADSHKNKSWQNFAAATAASVTKALVECHIKTDKRSRGSTRWRENHPGFTEEDKACIRDLRNTDPRDDKTRIEETKGGLLKDSYCWILENDDFQEWKDNRNHRLLWIKGDPGKGKTMLLCGIINEMESLKVDYTISYFFCRASETGLNSATAVLRGIIYLFIIQRPSLISHVQEKYQVSGKRLFEDVNSWVALSKILLAMLKDPSLTNAMLVIDGLDECTEDLPCLMSFISQASCSHNAKWIVSSRNWPDIEQRLEVVSRKVRLCLELNEDALSTAVQAYVRYKVQRLSQNKKFDDKMRRNIEQRLITRADNTFLWVALVCQRLEEVAKWQVLRTIEDIPVGLNEFYAQMMGRIENLGNEISRLCQQVLRTVILAYRPLDLEELGQLSDFSEDVQSDIDSIEEIVKMCGSFLIIRNGTVYIIHQSAKDYLCKSTFVLPGGMEQEQYFMSKRLLSILLAPGALKRDLYNLHSPGFLIQDVSPPAPNPLTPIRYACVYWINHLDSSVPSRNPTYNDQSIESLLIQFFERKFLYWLECLSLLQSVSEGVTSLQKLEALCVTLGLQNVREIAWDANRFILAHQELIELAPLQVYASALIFSPTCSKIRQFYKKEELDWISLEPAEENWSPLFQFFSQYPEERELYNVASCVTFSVNGRYIGWATPFGVVYVWDTFSTIWPTELYTQIDTKPGIVKSIDFSGNYRRVMANCENICFVWDLNTNDRIGTFDFGYRYLSGHAILSHNGSQLALMTEATLTFWDIATNACIRTMDFSGSIESAIFLESHLRLATASKDNRIEVVEVTLDTYTGTSLLTTEHTARLEWVRLSPDGQRVYSLTKSEVKIWDVRTTSCLHILPTDVIDFGRWNKSVLLKDFWLATANDSKIEIWDLRQSVLVQVFSFPLGSSDFSMDGQWLATAVGCNIAIWDMQLRESRYLGRCHLINSETFPEIERQICNVQSVSLLDGDQLLALVYNSTKSYEVAMWSMVTGACLYELSVDWEPSFSRDGKWIASISSGTVKIWDTFTGTCRRTIQCGLNNAAFLSLSGDGCRFASTDSSRTEIWDTSTGTRILNTSDPGHSITGQSFSDDGQYFCCFLSNSTLRVWNTAIEIYMYALTGYGFPASDPLAVFSMDSRLLASGTKSGICVWDSTTGTQISGPFKVRNPEKVSFVFSKDARRLVALCYRSRYYVDSLQVWDVALGVCLQTMSLNTMNAFPNQFRLSVDPTTHAGAHTSFGSPRLHNGLADSPSQLSTQGLAYFGYGISADMRWIMKDEERFLWLPRQYREYPTVSGPVIALPLKSGRVQFLRFSETGRH
ncbi:Vegetative incompatibility protein HET-E-1 [Cladobotryum mycophilum]|uniref:Vegetative incompatibility protein HET-E-1 n=1 Tax=Cladobotryum mycophilum TaxID=491253 RepID=A0ABR0SK74_9HYPO